MNVLNLAQLPDSVDPMNYVAIELLEIIGHIKPDECEIDRVEAILQEVKQFFLIKLEKQ